MTANNGAVEGRGMVRGPKGKGKRGRIDPYCRIWHFDEEDANFVCNKIRRICLHI